MRKTFAWFGDYIRLCRDFEFKTNTSETIIQLAIINLIFVKKYTNEIRNALNGFS